MIIIIIYSSRFYETESLMHYFTMISLNTGRVTNDYVHCRSSQQQSNVPHWEFSPRDFNLKVYSPLKNVNVGWKYWCPRVLKWMRTLRLIPGRYQQMSKCKERCNFDVISYDRHQSLWRRDRSCAGAEDAFLITMVLRTRTIRHASSPSLFLEREEIGTYTKGFRVPGWPVLSSDLVPLVNTVASCDLTVPHLGRPLHFCIENNRFVSICL